jgi:Ni/Co efflux regulator RcnB
LENKSMKKFALVATTALALGASTLGSVAAAAPYNSRGNDRDHRPRVEQRHHGFYVVNGHRYERMRGPAWKAPKNYRHQSWKRGQRLPSEYRRVEVRDWRAYHLATPPRGYHYVRVGNDVILASIATGVISAVIANAFFN